MFCLLWRFWCAFSFSLLYFNLLTLTSNLLVVNNLIHNSLFLIQSEHECPNPLMGINCMFQCLTLILSQSPLGQVSSWRICVCYSKHNLKGNAFSLQKGELAQSNINALSFVGEQTVASNPPNVMKDKHTNLNADEIRGQISMHLKRERRKKRACLLEERVLHIWGNQYSLRLPGGK